jgi:hypothetical protein
MSARAPQPPEETPRRRGRVLAAIFGTVGGLIALAFLMITLVVVLIVLLG